MQQMYGAVFEILKIVFWNRVLLGTMEMVSSGHFFFFCLILNIKSGALLQFNMFLFQIL